MRLIKYLADKAHFGGESISTDIFETTNTIKRLLHI